MDLIKSDFMFLLNKVCWFLFIYIHMSCFHCVFIQGTFYKKKDPNLTHKDQFLENQISERYKINLFNWL